MQALLTALNCSTVMSNWQFFRCLSDDRHATILTDSSKLAYTKDKSLRSCLATGNHKTMATTNEETSTHSAAGDAVSSKIPYGLIYDLALGDEDARACKDISEEACQEQPHSFGIHVVALTLTKIGDGLADVKLTLAWVLSSLGAPAFFIPWLVPIRESLSLLPQLIIASKIRGFARRKLFWTFGSLVQGGCIALMGLAALLLDGAAAGLAVLSLLILFSLARGICSISSKDVMGKTIAKQRRGRVSGLATSAAGFATLVFGGLLLFDLLPTADASVLGGLLLFAGGLWLLAALIYAGLPEYPGATEGGKAGFLEAVKNLKLVVSDQVFRHFIITRSLFISTALVAPFYVALANQKTDSGLSTLALLLVLAGLANLLSSPFWGKFADVSSKQVLVAAGLLCGSLAAVVVLANHFNWPVIEHPAWYAGVIFILYIGHAGVRLGRKTYLVDMANQDNRATLVAVSNTLIGLILLVAGGLSTLVAQSGVNAAVLTFGGCSFLAALFASRLRHVSG